MKPAKVDTVVYIHIPKTAGSSLINELWPHSKGFLHVLPTFDSEQTTWDTYENTLSKVADDICAGSYDFITGHFTFQQISAIERDDCRFRYMTFFRDPVERVISEYFYTTSERHPGGDRFRGYYPTIEVFAEDPAFQNTMCRYLEAVPGEPLEDVFDRVRSFVYVGNVENYERSLRGAGRLFGADIVPRLKDNVGDYCSESVSAEMRARIAKLNLRDMALFQAFGPSRGRGGTAADYPQPGSKSRSRTCAVSVSSDREKIPARRGKRQAR